MIDMALEDRHIEPHIEPPKSDEMKARDDLKALLDNKPLTKEMLVAVDVICNDAEYLGSKVIDTPAGKVSSLKGSLSNIHSVFITELSEVSNAQGRLAAFKEMLQAVRAVEWQTLGGEQSHDLLGQAESRLNAADAMLKSTRETVNRKLEAIMKLPFVEDAIRTEAEKDDEKFNNGQPPAKI